MDEYSMIKLARYSNIIQKVDNLKRLGSTLLQERIDEIGINNSTLAR